MPSGGPQQDPRLQRRVVAAAAPGRRVRRRGSPASLAPPLTVGQRSPAELVDRYQLACRPVRDLIVDYLQERQPAAGLPQPGYPRPAAGPELLGRPGAPSSRHRQPAPAAGRRRRLEAAAAQPGPGGSRARRRAAADLAATTLTPVRAFYLDLACPGPRRTRPAGGRGPFPARSASEHIEPRKDKRRRKSRMDAGPASGSPSCRSWPAPSPARHARRPSRWRRPRPPRPAQPFTAAGQTPHPLRGPAWPAAGSGATTATASRHDLTGRRPRVLDMGDRRGAAGDRHPGRGTHRADPPQPDPVPAARHRRTGAAAADRPVQDRHRTAPARLPRPRRRPVRDHHPGPRTGRERSRWSPPTTSTSRSGCPRHRCCSSGAAAPSSGRSPPAPSGTCSTRHSAAPG